MNGVSSKPGAVQSVSMRRRAPSGEAVWSITPRSHLTAPMDMGRWCSEPHAEAVTRGVSSGVAASIRGAGASAIWPKWKAAVKPLLRMRPS